MSKWIAGWVGGWMNGYAYYRLISFLIIDWPQSSQKFSSTSIHESTYCVQGPVLVATWKEHGQGRGQMLRKSSVCPQSMPKV